VRGEVGERMRVTGGEGVRGGRERERERERGREGGRGVGGERERVSE
jgi:hypothetical protein